MTANDMACICIAEAMVLHVYVLPAASASASVGGRDFNNAKDMAYITVSKYMADVPGTGSFNF